MGGKSEAAVDGAFLGSDGTPDAALIRRAALRSAFAHVHARGVQWKGMEGVTVWSSPARRAAGLHAFVAGRAEGPTALARTRNP